MAEAQLRRDLNAVTLQRNDYHNKLQIQLSEMNTIRSRLTELEKNHISIVDGLKEQIRQLQEEIDEHKRKGCLGENDEDGSDSDHPPAKRRHVEMVEEPDVELVPISNSSGSEWGVEYPASLDQKERLKIEMVQNFVHDSAVCCVALTSDAGILATGCNKLARLFDVQTGKSIIEEIKEGEEDTDAYVRSVCFSESDKILAVGTENKFVRLYAVRTKKLLHTFEESYAVYAQSFSPNGRLFAVGLGNGSVNVYDLRSYRCMHSFVIDEKSNGKGASTSDSITSVVFSPDNEVLCAGSLRGDVFIWNVKTGERSGRYPTDSVYSVAFSPNGDVLASASTDMTVKVFSVDDDKVLKSSGVLEGFHKDYVLSVAFSNDGKFLFSGGKDRTVIVWNVEKKEGIAVIRGHRNSVISVDACLNGYFATGGGDMVARVWRYSE